MVRLSKTLLLTALMLPTTLTYPVYGSNVRCSYLFNTDLSFLNSRQLKEFVNYLVDVQKARERNESSIFLFVLRQNVYRKIQSRCAQGTCSETQLAQLIRQSLEETIKLKNNTYASLRRWRGLILIVSISVATAVTSQYLKQHIPENLKFFAEFVTIVSSIILYRAGAPLWDYLAGEVHRVSYRAAHGKSPRKSDDELAHLIHNYKVLQTKVTPMQQTEMARLQALLSNLDAILAQVVNFANDPQQHHMLQARLAYFIVKARRLFPEIDLSKDVDVLTSWKAIFVSSLKPGVELGYLKKGILEKIKEYDPQYEENRIYYARIVSRWFEIIDERS